MWVSALCAALLCALPLSAQMSERVADGEAREFVTLDAVIASVEAAYPPLLAARIEREVREGRLQSARGIFDLDLFAKYKTTPEGYYEYSSLDAGAEQFLGLWGASVYGGYRLSQGDSLPGYYDIRTAREGEGVAGIRLPVLRDGWIDKDRAAVQKADLDRQGAGPLIDRQRLDFVRAASVAYHRWVAAGRKVRLARSLLELAQARQTGLEAQVEQGLLADIVLVDNRRLVVSRELELISAQRSLDASALTLSLFYRDVRGNPITPDEPQVPALAEAFEPDSLPDLERAVRQALTRRPELAQLGFDLRKARVDRSVARNQLLPYLTATIETSRAFGDELYIDRTGRDWRAGIEFKMPLQMREARGDATAADGRLRQIDQRVTFARDRITTELRTAHLTVEAARQQIMRAQINVDLALELQAAEQERFRLGASDLLALQIREQAAFDAQVKAVDAVLDYETALADFRAASAEGVEDTNSLSDQDLYR